MTQQLTVRITRRAARHIEQAALWWEENRPLAPDALRDELEEAVAMLRVQPQIGAIARSARVKGLRRIHLSRVHYYLYYRVRADTIDVLALWHTSRGLGPSL